MSFNSFSDFLAMGGYGFYVWFSYGITALVLIFNAVAPILKSRELKEGIKRQIARQRSGENSVASD